MKKLVVRISEGLGNQFFMYANAYSLSKKLGYELFIDNHSAYKKVKIRSFLLDQFKIESKFISPSESPNNLFNYLIYKINKKTDTLRSKKKFIIERKYLKKSTKYEDYSNLSFDDTIFVEGYFESEKYFKEYKNDIKRQFQIKHINLDDLFLSPNQIKNENSVSIAIRQHRFSEKQKDKISIEKSNLFLKNTIRYIYKAIEVIKSKIEHPKFYIFSNDTTDLQNFFPSHKNFIIINHLTNKPLNDFYLSTLCKHYIVGPSTFHWWSAYLNENQKKICICPTEDLKFSSNIDIFPEEWIKL